MDFFLLLKIWVKISPISVSKNLSSKYSKKKFDHPKKSATDAFKTASKRAFQRITDGTSDLIDNEIAAAVAKSYAVPKSYDNNNNKIEVMPRLFNKQKNFENKNTYTSIYIYIYIYAFYLVMFLAAFF